MTHILLPSGEHWTALDIFVHGIFMVYLKLASHKFDITKNRDISAAVFFVPLFGTMFFESLQTSDMYV